MYAAFSLLAATLLASCTEPSAVVAAASPQVEQAALAASPLRALSGSYAITAITLETRYWDPNSGLPTTATAASVFDGLPTNRPGYTNEPYLMPDLAGTIQSIYDDGKWSDTAWTGIRNPAGAHNNVATRYRVMLTAQTVSVLGIQFGVDFLGGAMFLDGAPVAEDWLDPWWKGLYRVDTNSYVGCKVYVKDPCLPKWAVKKGVFAATLNLAPGAHVIEVIGFENGADGGAAGRIDAGSGFQLLVSSVQPPQTLSVVRVGGGAGRVTSAPSGLDCTSSCAARFPLGSSVTLTATAAPNSAFAGWTGACSGTGACTVSMYGARSVGAKFNAAPTVQDMTIETRYWDRGSFTQTGVGALSYFDGLPTNVAGYTNVAVPVTALVRNVELFTAPAIGANLNLGSRYVVRLNSVGTSEIAFRFSADMSAGGAMMLDEQEIAANWNGSAGGPLLAATAVLSDGPHTMRIVGFEDCCAGVAPVLEYNFGTGWIAVTAPPPPPTSLAVSVPNAGGRVSSSPAGIDCGSSCQANFATGSQVVLTATADPYFAFAGWGGACTGTGWCAVRMLQPARSVTADFNRIAAPLTVVASGAGSGAVTANPAGTSCGPNCWVYIPGASVTLTATPGANTTFGGWTVPGCAGPTCVVTVSTALSVGVRFDQRMSLLTVAAAGSGGGTVTSSPAGINCGTLCSASFADGSTVTLTATPAPGSTFDGWSGGVCVGTGPCVVTVGGAATVGATFTKLADSTPPTLSCAADPAVLWPVNHKLWDIKVKVSLTDAESGAAGFTLFSVTSNEPVNAAGDGNTTADVVGWTLGTADVSGRLRAERQGTKNDRIYTLTYRGFDLAGTARLRLAG